MSKENDLTAKRAGDKEAYTDTTPTKKIRLDEKEETPNTKTAHSLLGDISIEEGSDTTSQADTSTIYTDSPQYNPRLAEENARLRQENEKLRQENTSQRESIERIMKQMMELTDSDLSKKKTIHELTSRLDQISRLYAESANTIAALSELLPQTDKKEEKEETKQTQKVEEKNTQQASPDHLIYEEAYMENMQNALYLYHILTNPNQRTYPTQDERFYSGAELRAITRLAIGLNPDSNSEEAIIMTAYARKHFLDKEAFFITQKDSNSDSNDYRDLKENMTFIQHKVLYTSFKNDQNYSKEEVANWVRTKCSSPKKEMSQTSATAFKANEKENPNTI